MGVTGGFGPLVDPDWLASRLGAPGLHVFDVRFDLADPGRGRRDYLAGHIPGAVYLDLERDLSGPVGPHGGRHPLPDPEVLAEKLRRVGLDGDAAVVVYDDGSGLSAPRAWWLLGYLGLDRVAVLDGGFRLWTALGLPVAAGPAGEAAAARRAPGNFRPRVRQDWVRDVDYLRRVVSGPGGGGARTVIVDSRAPERYRGDVEPLDPVAGHIPGAVNLFWQENLRADGTWLDRESLARRFRHLRDADEVVVYCGSGVTACANILAMRVAGLENVRLYSGSWSDWCSYPDLPVARGEEARPQVARGDDVPAG